MINIWNQTWLFGWLAVTGWKSLAMIYINILEINIQKLTWSFGWLEDKTKLSFFAKYLKPNLLFSDILAHWYEIWDKLINIYQLFRIILLFGWLRANIWQQNGDFVSSDTFEILYVLLKFTKIPTQKNDKNGG